MKEKNYKYYLLQEYFKKYPEVFNLREKEYLLMASANDDFLSNYEIVREIYDEFGLIPKSENIYDGFADLIFDTCGIENKNIIEVGGGHLPRLAKRLSERQVAGTIKVYDPLLSIYEKSSPKLQLVREMFSDKTNVTDADLLVGLMPCGAALDIVCSAVKNNKDFLVALCEGGPHGDYFDYFESEEEWLSTVISVARSGVKDNDMGELVIEKSLVKYKDDYPVIYNKRK